MRKVEIRTFFTQYLQRHKLRVTPERFQVLEAALTARGHFDADQLFLALKGSGSKVSRATVYNTLEKLRESGILVRYRFGERLARYELAYNTQPHHHAVCTQCGKIEEFVDTRADRMARDAAATMHYALQDAVLTIYGICSSCGRHETKKD